MFFSRLRELRPSEVGVPSRLLEFIAGEFAARVAGLWPEPHAAFITAPASRRHLLCLALTFAGPDLATDADAILSLPLKRAIRIAVPGAPDGLARALDHVDERAWSAADYRQLVQLLGIHQIRRYLRHCDQISCGEIRALSRLPAPLLEGGLGKLSPCETAAGVIAEAFTAISRRDGDAVAGSLASRWSSAENLKVLATRVQEDIEQEVASPPFTGTDRLRPLSTKAALVDAAARYRNCLRSHLRYAATGSSAYYEWLETPGAVVEIVHDRLYGWTLDEARLAGNKTVAEPVRSAIIGELQSIGVRVGRTTWQLKTALDDLASTPPSPAKTEDQLIAELFGDWGDEE